VGRLVMWFRSYCFLDVGCWELGVLVMIPLGAFTISLLVTREGKEVTKHFF
jgi:hypothetical protein